MEPFVGEFVARGLSDAGAEVHRCFGTELPPAAPDRSR
jgi:hypothetical protein